MHVEDSKPAVVTVYDYYEKGESTVYTLLYSSSSILLPAVQINVYRFSSEMTTKMVHFMSLSSFYIQTPVQSYWPVNIGDQTNNTNMNNDYQPGNKQPHIT